MGEIIVITSIKGGVGKTTLASSLAFEFAHRGRKVLAVDMDFGAGGLDIALGREDEITTTFIDLLTGQIPLNNTSLQAKQGVFFLSAPALFSGSPFDGVEQETFNSLLLGLKSSCDFVIFDMPASGGAALPYLQKSGLVDLALLVTTPAPASVRAAERSAIRMEGFEKIKLVINCFYLTHPEDNPFGVVEIINRASVPILGVIPFDTAAEMAPASGLPLCEVEKSPAGEAVFNIAGRILGENVKLFEGVMKKRKRQQFY